MPAQPMAAVQFVDRNLGGDATSTANIIAQPSSSPFFQGSSSNDMDSDSGSNVSKTALEWIFAIAALLVIGSLSSLKYIRQRRARERSGVLQNFSNNSGRRLPRTTGLPFDSNAMHSSTPGPLPMSASLFYPPAMTRLPRASLISTTSSVRPGRGRRAAQGADIDTQGRRGGAGDTDDHDGFGDDKDMLPAYETVGSPPKYGYIDAEMPALPLRTLQHPPQHDSFNPFRTSTTSEDMMSNRSSSRVESPAIQFPGMTHDDVAGPHDTATMRREILTPQPPTTETDSQFHVPRS